MKGRYSRALTALPPGIIRVIALAGILAGAAPAHAGLFRDIRHALFPPRKSLEYQTAVFDASVGGAAVSQASTDSHPATAPANGGKQRMAKTHAHASRAATHALHKPNRARAAAFHRPLHRPAVRMARIEHRLSPQPRVARMMPAKPRLAVPSPQPRIAASPARTKRPDVSLPLRIASASPAEPKPHAAPAPAPSAPASARPPRIAPPPTQRIVTAIEVGESSIPLAPPVHVRASPLAMPQAVVAAVPQPATSAPTVVTLQGKSATEDIDKSRAPQLWTQPEPSVLDDALPELRYAAGVVLLLGSSVALIVACCWPWFGASAWNGWRRPSRPH